ncbi:MAG: hypothetical protein CM15mP74_09930 [Halieaceae bacterium]|nr:MAG: hypothetical protein CM15mP74_09930 [Halieaceae bacterium]
MTLVVFDLDGTLLDKTSKISGYTADTLALMRASVSPTPWPRGGRFRQPPPLRDHYFTLPMILKNGAIIWSPAESAIATIIY